MSRRSTFTLSDVSLLCRRPLLFLSAHIHPLLSNSPNSVILILHRAFFQFLRLLRFSSSSSSLCMSHPACSCRIRSPPCSFSSLLPSDPTSIPSSSASSLPLPSLPSSIVSRAWASPVFHFLSASACMQSIHTTARCLLPLLAPVLSLHSALFSLSSLLCRHCSIAIYCAVVCVGCVADLRWWRVVRGLASCKLIQVVYRQPSRLRAHSDGSQISNTVHPTAAAHTGQWAWCALLVV